jgi:NADPH2:quinone reductase
VPGGEVAGTVAALGAGVAGPPVGTAVFALVGDKGAGGYAQYAIAEAAMVIPTPPCLHADAACGIVVAGAAALLVLDEAARLRPGETVLVPAAARGVGGFAVQLAKRFGASRVVATAGTPAKRRAALARGADVVLDPDRPDWPEQPREAAGGRGVDVVLEMAGGPMLGQSLRALAPFGRAVVYGHASHLAPEPDDLAGLLYAPAPNQSITGFNLGVWFGLRPREAGAALERLIGWVASGEVTVPVGHVLPLAAAGHAHALLEGRGSTGKVVLKPWPDAAAAPPSWGAGRTAATATSTASSRARTPRCGRAGCSSSTRTSTGPRTAGGRRSP